MGFHTEKNRVNIHQRAKIKLNIFSVVYSIPLPGNTLQKWVCQPNVTVRPTHLSLQLAKSFAHERMAQLQEIFGWWGRDIADGVPWFVVSNCALYTLCKVPLSCRNFWWAVSLVRWDKHARHEIVRFGFAKCNLWTLFCAISMCRIHRNPRCPTLRMLE